MRNPLFMSSQKAISDRKLRKTQEIEEAAILNFQTTAVVDFQMATRSPSFTHLLKNIFKLFLKKTGLHTFLICTWHKSKSRIKSVQVNHLRENLPLGVENTGWELRTQGRGGGQHSATPGTFCVSTDHLYGSANDPRIPDLKWSPNWSANDPGPQMISIKK